MFWPVVRNCTYRPSPNGSPAGACFRSREYEAEALDRTKLQVALLGVAAADAQIVSQLGRQGQRLFTASLECVVDRG